MCAIIPQYFSYVVCLKLPSVALREKLWRKLLPERVPVSSDLDFAELANRYILHICAISSEMCRSYILQVSTVWWTDCHSHLLCCRAHSIITLTHSCGTDNTATLHFCRGAGQLSQHEQDTDTEYVPVETAVSIVGLGLHSYSRGCHWRTRGQF